MYRSVHVPPAVTSALEETSAFMGGLPIDSIIESAIWSFTKLPSPFKKFVMREYLNGSIVQLPTGKDKVSLKEYVHGLGCHLVAKIRARLASQGWNKPLLTNTGRGRSSGLVGHVS